jgi:RNA polymerase sigma-70 factor (ECF subfamily)
MTDEELIGQIKDGVDTALEELMSRYMRHIYNFTLQYVRIKEEAEDVTQETFFKAWKHIKRFKEGMKFKPWLFTIAKNTALDYIKKKKATPFSNMNDDTEDTDFADTISDTEPLPSELFAQKELASKLDETMKILHPDHRAVIIMHYREELTFDEIAKIMNKPMNTIKSWHHRSIIRVKDNLMHQKGLYERT